MIYAAKTNCLFFLFCISLSVTAHTQYNTVSAALITRKLNPIDSTSKTLKVSKERYKTAPPLVHVAKKTSVIQSFSKSEFQNVSSLEKWMKNNNLVVSFKRTTYAYPKNQRRDLGIAYFPIEKLMLYMSVLKQYVKQNSLDTSYAFIANMGMLPSMKRFYVINLNTMTIVNSGLVSHGRGTNLSMYDRQYSNAPGSRCTSLGRYKITQGYRGAYGPSYRMIGLDSTNNNAFNRNIVMHPMTCIPDTEGMMPACVSDGCPALSTQFFSYVSRVIESSKKPILLWVFDSNLEEPVVISAEQNNSRMVTMRQ